MQVVASAWPRHREVQVPEKGTPERCVPLGCLGNLLFLPVSKVGESLVSASGEALLARGRLYSVSPSLGKGKGTGKLSA